MLFAKTIQSVVSVILGVCVLTACQTMRSSDIDIEAVLFDQGFSGARHIQLEDQQAIFSLSDEARQFVKNAIGKTADPVEQMTNLVEIIFGHSQFNLLYDGNANTTASETFKNRAANCLSMSIMTYALAKEAGIGVDFQEVDIPEFWTRRDGYSLLNGHINLRLTPKADPQVYQFQTEGYQVDFDPESSRQHFSRRIVSRNTVLAMYYNNKGADALVNNRFTEAYAYFKQAILSDNMFESSLINLGFLYRLNGHYSQAQMAYEYALKLNPDSLTAMENLAYLFSITDRSEQASVLLTKVERKRADNPYYFVNLGETELDLGNYQAALQHFKKALSLSRKTHETYFGLARTYFKLGDKTLTEHYLQLAKDYANNTRDEARYQSKLNFLTSL